MIYLFIILLIFNYLVGYLFNVNKVIEIIDYITNKIKYFIEYFKLQQMTYKYILNPFVNTLRLYLYVLESLIIDQDDLMEQISNDIVNMNKKSGKVIDEILDTTKNLNVMFDN